MTHLNFEYIPDAPLSIETEYGTEIVPEFLITPESHISDYLDGKNIKSMTSLPFGVVWRLSADGYLDCTSWSYSPNIEEAKARCESEYQVDPNTGKSLED
jgi:hypothetical protein